MAHEKTKSQEPQSSQLPPLVVGPAEINRLLRELGTIDNTLLEHKLRKRGSSAQMLKTSPLMDQLASSNGLNLLQQTDREKLQSFLEGISQTAPVMHMSFSTDPTQDFLERLMTWLRKEIHPQLMVTTGVQPAIAAGCTVRTTNKYFDFSLRQNFLAQRSVLLEQIAGSGTEKAGT